MEPAATVRVLVRNFSSDTNQVQFSKFEIESMRDSNKWDAARKYIPEVMRNEWVLTREYDVIPPAYEAWSGFGAIPNDIEDTLLLLRLYKPGDLAFAAVIFTTPETNSLARQCPYRVNSNLVSNHSLRPYTLNQAETADWEKFEAGLRASPAWESSWFKICRRCFLYGGSQEFNPNFEFDIDRVIDYTSSLEAALIPEHDFLSRRLCNRALKLLEPQSDTESKAIKVLLKKMYGIRSSLVHGSPLKDEEKVIIQQKELWLSFEQLVRTILICALRNVPSSETDRRTYLSGLYEPSDQDRADKLREDFRTIKDIQVKQVLLNELSTS